MAIENLIQNLKNESSEELALALNDVRAGFKKYVVVESEPYFDALTLWVGSTYTPEAFQFYPRLVLSSPEKQCGKTTLLTVIKYLVHNPLSTSNISTPALFRVIESELENRIVVLMDEVDKTFSKNGDKEKAVAITQIINSGYIKGETVIRCEGQSFKVRKFGVSCPVVMAGIGKTASPEEIRDRGIIIPMRRILEREGVNLERLRLRVAELEFAPIRERLNNAITHRSKELQDLLDREVINFPDSVVGRPRDVWENLFAVAHLAGGEWPERARLASLELCDKALLPESQNYKVEALSLCRDVFEVFEEDRISASDLVVKISNLEHSPYKDHSYPLNAKRLANLLDEFGIRSVKQNSARYYHRKDFEKSWESYL